MSDHHPDGPAPGLTGRAAARPVPDPTGVSPAAGTPTQPAPASAAVAAPAPAPEWTATPIPPPADPAATVAPAAVAPQDVAPTAAAPETTAAPVAQPRALGRAAGPGATAARATTAAAPVPASDRTVATNAPLAPPRPGRPRAEPLRGRFGGLHVGQVVSWEIALAAVLLVHRQPWQVLVPVVAAAALLVGVTALRVRGRWVHEWISVWLRFRTRRRRMIVTPDQPDGATQVLDVLSRGARMDVLDLEDERAALIISATGLAVVLEPVHQEPGRMIDTRVVLPSLSTLLAPGESDDPELTAQIVVQTVPAPGLIGEDDPAALSYRELAGGTVPARRRCWIALQAPFTPEDVDDAAQRALLVTGVHRVRRRLRRAGLSARVLDPDEALADLLALTGMPVLPGAAPVAPPAGGVSAREGWSTWRAGETLHSSYRVLDWPDLGRPEGRAFLNRLTSSPALASTLAIAARRRGPEIELEGVLRVTAPTEEVLQRSDRALQSLAQECAARLQPLLGEQNAGLAGSLPLGGFHR